VWFTVCQRCACRLRRITSGGWRQISQDEYFTVIKRIEAKWQLRPFESSDAFQSHNSISPADGSSERPSAGAAQGYDSRYFARKHGIALEEARKIIASGGDRKALNAAAAQLNIRVPGT
jgi:hypothetical protein